MREDYELVEPISKMEIEVEKDIHETLQAMSQHTKLTVSQMANTALKRFISQHKDFLPRNIIG